MSGERKKDLPANYGGATPEEIVLAVPPVSDEEEAMADTEATNEGRPEMTRRILMLLGLVTVFPTSLIGQQAPDERLCESEAMRYSWQCRDQRPLTDADWEQCIGLATRGESPLAPLTRTVINAEFRCRWVLRALGSSEPPVAAPEPSPPPVPAATTTPTRRPTTTRRQPPRRACCRVCRTGKACGNSCISRSYTCRRPPGCACNGDALTAVGFASVSLSLCDLGLAVSFPWNETGPEGKHSDDSPPRARL